MRLAFRRYDELPNDYAYPLDKLDISKFADSFLQECAAVVDFEYFENTSDVLLVSTRWDSATNLWSLRVIAALKDEVAQIHQTFIQSIFPELQEWMCAITTELNRNPELWTNYDCIYKFENFELISTKYKAERKFRRPPPRSSIDFMF
ncbi:MAG: hypothetical protein EKK48_10425 [Candidatus Melainabacteria bacterium]|nr:MAG: hypothetical protein EKK48_10425 [Candidatus Melainabacteria bacterium]